MSEENKKRLRELKSRLEELKKHDPSHCSGRETFTPHSMPPAVYRQIEELEGQIKALEREVKAR